MSSAVHLIKKFRLGPLSFCTRSNPDPGSGPPLSSSGSVESPGFLQFLLGSRSCKGIRAIWRAHGFQHGKLYQTDFTPDTSYVASLAHIKRRCACLNGDATLGHPSEPVTFQLQTQGTARGFVSQLGNNTQVCSQQMCSAHFTAIRSVVTHPIPRPFTRARTEPETSTSHSSTVMNTTAAVAVSPTQFVKCRRVGLEFLNEMKGKSMHAPVWFLSWHTCLDDGVNARALVYVYPSCWCLVPICEYRAVRHIWRHIEHGLDPRPQGSPSPLSCQSSWVPFQIPSRQ